VTAESDGIGADEYRSRIARVRDAVKAAGLVGLVAFGDCWRGANVGYFTEFRPLDGVSDIANAVAVIPADGEAALVVSEQCVSRPAPSAHGSRGLQEPPVSP
jgi:Xaa-Pro aminopeptidase